MLAEHMLRYSSGLLLFLSACALNGQTLVASRPQGSASARVAVGQPASAAPTGSGHSFNVFVWERARGDAWQWFDAPPYRNEYRYLQSFLRVGMTQRIARWDWELEMGQPSVLDAPSNAVAPGAQGQLGLGGTYYAASGNNGYPAAAFLKQGFVRYGLNESSAVRLGRFEFFGGTETHPKDPTMLWLQNNRMQQRLIGNFGFANAMRSFDGLDAHANWGAWNLTGAAARADQGVFNMNGNPEINADFQYLALTRTAAKGRVIARAFGIGYHDGRTGLTKSDNRPLTVRQADHKNIRLGTYGGSVIATAPAGPGLFDFIFWGALQNGNWGKLSDSAGAAAVEGGYRATKIATQPWLRAGWSRATGDNNPADNKQNTFFQLLPTPRVYARLPFYNLMNNTDTFVQAIDRPAKRLELRSDLHWLDLTSSRDLWYLGGGAFDNKVFGFTGRPAGGHTSFASVADISSDWQATSHFAFNVYYGHGWGKSVVRSLYPKGPNIQLGYLEMIYRWGTAPSPK